MEPDTPDLSAELDDAELIVTEWGVRWEDEQGPHVLELKVPHGDVGELWARERIGPRSHWGGMEPVLVKRKVTYGAWQDA